MRTKKMSKTKSYKDVSVGFAGIATMALGVTALSLFGKALVSIRDKLKDRKIIKKIQSGELKEYEDFVKPLLSIYLNEIKGNISEQKYILSKWKHVSKEEYEKYGKEKLEKERQEEQNIMSKLKKEYERAKQVRTFDDLLEVFPDHPYLRKEIERSKYLLQKAKSKSTTDSIQLHGKDTRREKKILPSSRKRLKLNDNKLKILSTKKLSTKQQEVDMNIKRYIDAAVKKELRRLHQRSRVTPQKKVYTARRHNDYLELLDGKKIWAQVKKMIKTILAALKQTVKEQPVYSNLLADFLKLYAFWDGLVAVRDIGRAEYLMFKRIMAKIKQEESDIETKQIIKDLVSGVERLGLAFFKLFFSKKIQTLASAGTVASAKKGRSK